MKVTSEFTVGDRHYQVNMWHPDKALENLAWLIKMVGEPIVAVLVQSESIKDLLDSDIDLTVLTPAVRSLVANINEKEIVLKVRSFVEGMHCDGKKFEYDSHFMGRPGHLIKVVVQVLKAQYADFFDELPDGIVGAKSVAAGSHSSLAQ